jgi:hypothetical protein
VKQGGRLRPRSQKREDDADRRWEVRHAVFVRDHWTCRLGRRPGRPGVPPCRGDLTPHHLRKASDCGPYTRENLVALCAGHNGWVEDAPELARSLGLVERGVETPADTWRRLHAAGLAADPIPGAGPGPGLTNPPPEENPWTPPADSP